MKTKSWIQFFKRIKKILWKCLKHKRWDSVYLPIFIAIMLFISLQKLLEAFYFKLILLPIFDFFKTLGSPEINYCWISITYLIFLIWYFSKRIYNKYQPSLNTALWCISILSIYFYYRLNQNSYHFISLLSIPWLYYADIFFTIPAIVILGLSFYHCFKKARKYKPELNFKEDIPIETQDQDDYQRKEIANDLALKIKNLKNKKAFAIGIVGTYGTGKTSFLNLIQKELETDKQIIPVKFNPWLCQDPRDIVSEFFKVLEQEVGQHIEFSHKLIEYGQELTQIDNDSVWNKFYRKVISVFSKETPHQQRYNDNNQVFERLKKKVVVFIDDVDRLDKGEVVEVIRLIRNTAEFNKLIFVAAFDRDYVLEAIKDINKHNHQYYLEKIFQIEIPIPNPDPDKLFSKFIERMLAICKKTTISKTETENWALNIIQFIELKPVGVEDHERGQRIDSLKELFTANIKNERDSIRYTNAIIFDFPKLYTEVYLKDFFLVQILKLKYYALFKLLEDNREELLKIKQESSNRKMGLTIKNNDPENFLNRLTNEEKINGNHHEKIKAILENLFPWENNRSSIPESELKSIRNPDNYSVYFSNQIFDSTISFKEFQALTNG